MEVAITFIALFASAFGIMYMYFVTRNKERLMMIENGNFLPSAKNKEPKTPRPRRNNSIKFALKSGMFLIGVGAGFVISVLLVGVTSRQLFPLIVVGTVLITGGAGLVAGYFVGLRIDVKSKE